MIAIDFEIIIIFIIIIIIMMIIAITVFIWNHHQTDSLYYKHFIQ